MIPRITEATQATTLRILLVFAWAILVGVVFSPGIAFASDARLNRAFEELQAERFERALNLLDDALDDAENPEEASKLSYYRAFALEKLGQCELAELAYRRVLDGSNQKLRTFARESLSGFDDRCVAASKVEQPVQLERGSGRVGWKVFGWTTMILGGLTLAALPVKHSLERNVTSQAEPYFSLQYNCKVEDGDVSGQRCDRDGLEKDDAYLEYQESLATANKWSKVMIFSGIGAASVGLTTLILVAVTRPDAADLQVSFVPLPSGGMATAGIRF